jgi:hypothetical protein
MLSIVIIPLSVRFILSFRVVREGHGLIRVVHVVVVEETVVAVGVPCVVATVTQATPNVGTVPGECPVGWCK